MSKKILSPLRTASFHMTRSFFLFTALFLFLLFMSFPLISHGESHHLSTQPKSNSPDPRLNSLKASSSPSSDKASRLFEEALTAMENKDYKTAKQDFEKLIFNYPQNPETSICCFYLGGIYQREGLVYEAKAIYSQFIEQYPDHQLLPEILSRQAEIHFQQKEIKKAQKIFKQLLFQHPDTNLALKATFRLGDCFYESDDLATARLYYYEGMKKLPSYIENHPQTALNIGQLYLEDHQFEQSLTVFSNVEKKFSHTGFSNKAATFCGDVYMEQGKIQEALQAYQRVINNYPHSIGAQISKIRMANMGIEYRDVEINDPDQIFRAFYQPVTTYQELIEKECTDRDLAHLVEYKLGAALQKEKKYKEAINVFRSILAKNPEPRIYQNSLHTLKETLIEQLDYYFHQKKYFKVIKIYENNKYLLNPFFHESKNPIPYFRIGCSYQNLGFYAQALHLYQKCKKTEPSLCPGNTLCDQIQLHLGQIFFQTNKFRKALDSIKNINKKSDPSLNFDALTLAGDIYYEQKSFTKAADCYLDALKNNVSSENARYLFKISQCYQKLGNPSHALNFLHKAADSAQKKEDAQQMVQIYLSLALLQYNAQNYAGALKTYQKLQELSLSPVDKNWILFQIGNCSQKQIKKEEALNTFEQLKTSTQDPMWSMIADFKDFEIRQIQ